MVTSPTISSAPKMSQLKPSFGLSLNLTPSPISSAKFTSEAHSPALSTIASPSNGSQRPPAMNTTGMQMQDGEYSSLTHTLSLARSLLQLNVTWFMSVSAGALFVDGMEMGVGVGGIIRPNQDHMKHSKLPMRERLIILCKLGSGASSAVYKALDLVELRLVALKTIQVFERYA
jgi:hypothetical protein